VVVSGFFSASAMVVSVVIAGASAEGAGPGASLRYLMSFFSQ
jgi:hypothetical protein